MKVRYYYKKRSIVIKYAVFYIYIKNDLVEHRWDIIITIKDLILINSGLLNILWAKVIEIANYLQNNLSTKTKVYKKIIFEEIWIKKMQKLQYIHIFGSLVLYNIPKKKD